MVYVDLVFCADCFHNNPGGGGFMSATQKLLTAAGILSLAVAVFQAAVSFSPSMSVYLGAPAEIAASPVLLIIVGLAAAVVFLVFGLYGLSGAGLLRRLPLLRLGLVVIGAIYALRGLLIVLVALVKAGIVTGYTLPGHSVTTSLIPLVIGFLYLAGTIGEWKSLAK